MSDDDLGWYAKYGHEEVDKKYDGQYVAIWNKQVVGHGKTPHEAWEMALKKHPDSDPLMMKACANPPDFGL